MPIMKSGTKKLQYTILMIEDDEDDALIVHEMLSGIERVTFSIKHANRLQVGLDYLSTDAIDLVLLDLNLPDSHGLDTLDRVQVQSPEIPVILMTGLDDERFGNTALKMGAQDYLVKGHFNDDQLEHSIRYAIERQRLKIEREKIEKEKMDFLSAVSHEFRTPLTSVNNAITIIETAGELNEDQREFLTMAIRNIDRLNKLSHQILNISKMESGTWKYDFQMMDIKPLVVYVVSILKLLADHNGIGIINEIPDKLPEVYADKDKLEQVFINLIENAIKHTPKDGLITLEASFDTHYMQFSVSDTGIGISPEDQKEIFDMFKQVNTSTKMGKGFGLGLAIVKKIIDTHNGKIWVESEIGKGSKFIFTIPLRGTHAS